MYILLCIHCTYCSSSLIHLYILLHYCLYTTLHTHLYTLLYNYAHTYTILMYLVWMTWKRTFELVLCSSPLYHINCWRSSSSAGHAFTCQVPQDCNQILGTRRCEVDKGDLSTTDKPTVISPKTRIEISWPVQKKLTNILSLLQKKTRVSLL